MLGLGFVQKIGRSIVSSPLKASAVTSPIAKTALERRSGLDSVIFRHTPLAKFYRENNLQTNRDVKKFLKSHISPEKFLGEGKDFKVYDMGEHVLRIPKKPKTWLVNYDRFNLDFDNLVGRNFGQAIAQNSSGVQIARKEEGEPLLSGLGKNWLDCYTRKTPIGKREANIFFDHLKQVSAFSDETLTKYVDDVVYLNKKGYCVDMVNPNNFLYDKKAGRLNILDIAKGEQYRLTSSKLVEPLVDKPCFTEYYEHLTAEQRKQAVAHVADLHLRVAQIASKAGVEVLIPDFASSFKKETDFDFNNPNFRAVFK